jgi:hypothetical protein
LLLLKLLPELPQGLLQEQEPEVQEHFPHTALQLSLLRHRASSQNFGKLFKVCDIPPDSFHMKKI